MYLQRDERDTAFAQAYLATAKEELKGDRRKYEALLGLLNQFGKSNSHPVEVRLQGQLVFFSLYVCVHVFFFFFFFFGGGRLHSVLNSKE